MVNFVFQGLPSRVVFGAGSSQAIAQEVNLLGAERALVLCTPGQRGVADRVARQLGDRCAGVFDGAAMHVPIESARQARDTARALGADCAVAIGGGSTIGLGKAIALESPLPILAIPTTYAGSEMTPIYGITEGGLKKTGRDARVLPKTVVYDPDLTVSLPVAVSVTSAMNAIAHAAEGLYAQDCNPVLHLMAIEGLRTWASALPSIRQAPQDQAGRSQALYAAWLCGAVLGNTAMGIHHKLCHTLGGSFGLPHAETHTVVLPHALAYNRAHAQDAMQHIAQALRGEDAALAVFDLAQRHGATMSLRALGMREADLDRACAIAMQSQYPNPRALESGAVRRLLQDAYEGRCPTA